MKTCCWIFTSGRGILRWLEEKVETDRAGLPPDAAEQAGLHRGSVRQAQRLEFRVPAGQEIYVFESRIVAGGEHSTAIIGTSRVETAENGSRHQQPGTNPAGARPHDGGQHRRGSPSLCAIRWNQAIAEAQDALEITELVKQASAIQDWRAACCRWWSGGRAGIGLVRTASTTAGYRVACDFTCETPWSL